ncbi:MAG: DUF885 domain-containing protein, partial [Bifidobacteriaceae bacterium]|nr:DUF885 domain-containing protein [Bifidobacteriaceae bacterium]
AIFARLDNIPKAVRGYIKSLQKGIEIGVVNTVRQCQLVIEQIDNQIDQKISFFATLPKLARDKNIDNRLVKNIEKALDKVYKSFIKLKEFLQENYIPAAQKDDAVGQERYKYYAKHYVGQDINIENSYKYGIEEIDRIMQEQFSLAKGFGAQSDNGVEAVKEAARILNSRPEQAIAGADNLKKYMQSTADKAMQYLVKNNHFDIPKLVQTVQAMIVPTGDGVVYYTPPTADFSVPGRMWWSIPEGVETQYKWNSKSTIFHEGVPGHHLQVGLQVYLKDKLNDWQRMALLISGYAEGWALYAEQLMDEFGMLSLEEKFGMLDMQKLRAARIVIDIGVHCKMEVPAHWQKRYGEGIWDYDKAKIFLADMVNMNEGFRKFELDRYMGLPGQAIAYKLGQKNWLELRQKAMTKGWTLKEFHDKALSWGCLSFNLLDKALFG